MSEMMRKTDKDRRWYSTSYRRNLVDMHLEDWDPAFMSRFDPVSYCENLKKAHIKSAMIYFHSHVGYSYYPTKVGKMHSALIGREDAMRQLVDLCHEAGIDVVGYYSLIHTTLEEERHPEWRLVNGGDGTSPHQRGGRYGFCCPNNPEYRQYVREQIKEISEYFTVDGMFYDMTFWPGICRCPHCQMRFLKETGNSWIPAVENWNDPVFVALQKKREEWIGEFAEYVTAVSKEFMPHASVEHNYAYGVAGDWNQASSERVSQACDYVGGDLHTDIYTQSFTEKYYRSVTRNQPFEYMISRCDENLGCHTITKSEMRLKKEVLLTSAHHGASFVIDAMDPVGTMDSRVYERIGKVFEQTIPYEPYFEGAPIEDVAVYYSPTGRYRRNGRQGHTRSCSVNLMRTMIQNNVPVGVISNLNSGRMSGYKMVFAPALAGLDDQCRHNICEYVKDGGVLYFSGTEEPALLKELLGISLDGYTPTSHNYISPTEGWEALLGEFNGQYPLPMEGEIPLLKQWRCDAEVLAQVCMPYRDEKDPKRFSSIHSNPPAPPTSYPAMLRADYGKGKVVWCAASFENDIRTCYRDLTDRILRMYLSVPEQSVISNAPHQVELCCYKTDGGYQINALDLLCTEELFPMPSFEVGVRMSAEEAAKVEGVSVLPNGSPMEYRYEDGFLKFCIPSLIMYQMIGIKIKK